MKVDLIVRLSIRLAKALCHGVRAGTISKQDLDVYKNATSQLRDASTGNLATTANDDLARSWKEWDATQSEYIEDSQRVDACLSGLSRLPLFCKPLYVLSTRLTILPYNVLTFPPETTQRSSFRSVDRMSGFMHYSYPPSRSVPMLSSTSPLVGTSKPLIRLMWTSSLATASPRSLSSLEGLGMVSDPSLVIAKTH